MQRLTKECLEILVKFEDLDRSPTNGPSEAREYLNSVSKGSTLVRIDDVGNLKEVLIRRLGHPEWTLPNLIVVDGGVAQRNVAKEVLKERNFDIDVVSVVKDSRHKAREIIGSKGLTLGKFILLANSEAHRFAISYHRKLRGKGFRI